MAACGPNAIFNSTPSPPVSRRDWRAATRYNPLPGRGCYDLVWGTPTLRLIVLNAIEPHPRNAPWELFSSRQDRIRHGAAHYRPRRPETWELLRRL